MSTLSPREVRPYSIAFQSSKLRHDWTIPSIAQHRGTLGLLTFSFPNPPRGSLPHAEDHAGSDCRSPPPPHTHTIDETLDRLRMYESDITPIESLSYLLDVPVPHIEVKRLGRGCNHAPSLAQELHALDLVKHDQGGGLVHVEEGPLQGVQVAVVSLQRGINRERRLEVGVALGWGGWGGEGCEGLQAAFLSMH